MPAKKFSQKLKTDAENNYIIQFKIMLTSQNK